MTDKKNIVVVGAGFSGVFAAKKLAKKLKKDYQVVLIDRHSFMTYRTELHEVATERVSAEHVQEDLQMLFHKSRKVKLMTAEVTKVDANKKIVKTTKGDVPYEKLVIATGGESNDFGTPGVKKYGFELWTLEQALVLRHHLRSIITDAAMELNPVKRAQMLTIAVVGSGFTGTELVGELIEFKKVLAEENKLNEDDIKLVMLEAAPTILNMLKDRNLAYKAEEYMKANGVNLITSAKVVGVTKDAVVFEDGSQIPTKTLIWTAGVKNKTMIGKWGLNYEPGRGGRVIVDQYMHIDGQEDIFVIGDDAQWVDPKDGPTPQTVQGGESMAITAVKNILAELKGEPGILFKRIDWGFAVSIGSHFTVATIFNKFNFSGFLANLTKHAINIFYFLQIHSLGSIVKYLNNEFFRMENGREPFHGAVSRRGNTLWTLPLRIALGIGFINAGTGNSWNLPTFTGSATENFINVLVGVFLLLGLLSFPAAGVAFLMTFVFAIMHGFDFTSVMLMLGSFAMMNGGGRGFGLDLFVFPQIKKLWKRIWYGKEYIEYDEITLDK